MLKHLLTIKNLDSAKKGVVLAEYYLACEQALGEIRPWEVTRERHAKGDASAFSRGPSLATRNKEELAHSDDTFANDPLVSCGLAKCSLGNCGEISSFISLLPSPSLRAFSTFLRPPPPTFPPPCPGQRVPCTTWTRGSSDFKSDGPSNNFLCYKPLHFFYFKFFFFSSQEDVVFLGLKNTRLLLESGNVYGPGRV